MSTGKALLYINSKGYAVTRHSYSGGETFRDCAKKYYLQRVQGWVAREDRAARHFGTALEHAVTFWHQRGQNIAAAEGEFMRLWAEHKDKDYIYSKTEGDWDRLGLTGRELLKLYTLRYPTLPYVVKNPKDSFQINVAFELFPGTKLAGIEFTGYIDLQAELKETGEPLGIDMKTSGKDIPDLTILDPQLRSYAWAKAFPWWAFLWFRKMGREISKGDKVTLLEARAGLEAGTDAVVMGSDDFGVYVTTDPQIEKEINTLFVGKSKAVEAAKQAYIIANGKMVDENLLTKQRVQFKAVYITPESADDIGYRIKQDVVNITNANEKDRWLMESGVRFPHEKCPNCEMRGICSDNADLRDALLTRNQLDELDFSNDSE